MKKKATYKRYKKDRMEMATNRCVTNYVLLKCLMVMVDKIDEIDKNTDYIKRVLESKLQ